MDKLLKVYAWASGIVVAFIASYLTGVLTAVIPPPKDLLCKLSLGFCPPAKVIAFSATDVDLIVDHDGVGQGSGQNQIGMLHNRVDPNVETNVGRPNMVKYKFTTDVPGAYQLKVFYASPNSRSVELFVNDEQVASDALAKPTGGGDNQDRRWSTEYPVKLNSGDNTLLVKRSSVFPHLSKFELTQVRR
jgi:hypothetical protein